MAHSHDQTMLARLGFQDIDRECPEHDFACRYLALPAQKQRLARLIHGEGAGAFEGESHFEKAIRSYNWTVGYADLVFAMHEREPSPSRGGWGKLYLVDVKANRVSASDILRQLNLYQGYLGYTFCKGASDFTSLVAATLYPIAPADRAMLRSQGVHTIRLGEPFQAWLAAQRDLSANESSDEVF